MKKLFLLLSLSLPVLAAVETPKTQVAVNNVSANPAEQNTEPKSETKKLIRAGFIVARSAAWYGLAEVVIDSAVRRFLPQYAHHCSGFLPSAICGSIIGGLRGIIIAGNDYLNGSKDKHKSYSPILW